MNVEFVTFRNLNRSSVALFIAPLSPVEKDPHQVTSANVIPALCVANVALLSEA
ncbi:MAG: hypothetical protein ACYC7D_15295 [Nitrososphaerales archaeon]